MKNYIATAALAVASILITAAALNSAEPQATGQTTTPTAEQIKAATEEMEATVAERVRQFGLTNLVPVKRPEVLVKIERVDGKQIVHSIVTKEDGRTNVMRLSPSPIPENPAEYQPGMVRKTTTLTETCGEFLILVMTSTDLTNWYPVSYGERYPETKQPRYFRMWTMVDDRQAEADRALKRNPEALARLDEMIKMSSGETQERLKKTKQRVENSK